MLVSKEEREKKPSVRPFSKLSWLRTSRARPAALAVLGAIVIVFSTLVVGCSEEELPLLIEGAENNQESTASDEVLLAGPTAVPANDADNVSTTTPIHFTFDGTTNLALNPSPSIPISFEPEPKNGTFVLSVAKSATKSMVRLQRTGELDAGTTYTITIPKGFFVDGTAKSPLITTSFTTRKGHFAGFVARPSDGAKNIPLNSQIILDFDDPVVVNEGATAVVTHDGHPLTIKLDAGHLREQPHRTLFTLRPYVKMAPQTTYRLRIPAGSFSLQTNLSTTNDVIELSFTTGNQMSLGSVETTPANHAQDVAVDATIHFHFEHAIGVQWNTRAFLNDGQNEVVVLLEATSDADQALGRPASSLEPDTPYTLRVPAGSFWLDADRNVTNDEFSVAFTTASRAFPGFTIAPLDRARNIPVASPIVFSFQGAVAVSSGAELRLSEGTNVVRVPFGAGDLQGGVLTVQPPAALKHYTTYRLSIAAGSLFLPEDPSKTNELITSSFLTMRERDFATVSFSPADGSTGVRSDLASITLTFSEDVALRTNPTRGLRLLVWGRYNNGKRHNMVFQLNEDWFRQQGVDSTSFSSLTIPVSGLKPSATYTITLVAGWLTLASNPSTINIDNDTATFSTRRLKFPSYAESPAGGSVGVPIDTVFTFTFDSPVVIKGNSFNGEFLHHVDGRGLTEIPASTRLNGNVLEMFPAQGHSLPHGKIVLVRMYRGAIGLAADPKITNTNTIGMVIETSPNRFPTYVATPSSGSSGVATDTVFKVEFDHAVVVKPNAVASFSYFGPNQQALTTPAEMTLSPGDLLSLSPAQGHELEGGTDYALQIDAGSLAEASDSSLTNAEPIVVRFTTAASGSVAANGFPGRRSTPTNNATNVPVDRPISFAFSGDVALAQGASAILSGISFLGFQTSATLDLAGALQNNVLNLDADLDHFTTYRLTLPAGSLRLATDSSVESPLIQLNFRTASEAFATVETSPANNERYVRLGRAITFTFSKPIRLATGANISPRLVLTTFGWRGSETSTTNQLDASMIDSTGRVLTFEPPNDFEDREEYRVRLLGRSVSLVSDPSSMNDLIEFEFSTIPRTFLSYETYPENNDTNIYIDTAIFFDFQHNVEMTSTSTASLVNGAGVSVPVTMQPWSSMYLPIGTGGNLKITATQNLDYDTAYTLTIPAGSLRKSDEHALKNDDLVLRFRTAPEALHFPSFTLATEGGGVRLTFSKPILLAGSTQPARFSDGTRIAATTTIMNGTNAVILPSRALAFDTEHTLIINQGGLTLRDNSSVTNNRIRVRFRTPVETFADLTFTPSGEEDVSINLPSIKLDFNKPVKLIDGSASDGFSALLSGVHETRGRHTLRYELNASELQSDLGVDPNSFRSITLPVNETLWYGTRYYLLLARDKLALVANTNITNTNTLAPAPSFTTEQEPFADVSFTPANNATEVPIDTLITVTFSKYVRLSGRLLRVYVSGTVDGTVVDSFEFLSTPENFIMTPAFQSVTYRLPRPLLKSTRYSVRIPAGDLALSTNDSATNREELTGVFTTVDEFAEVVSTSPENGASNLDPSSPFRIAFDFDNPVMPFENARGALLTSLSEDTRHSVLLRWNEAVVANDGHRIVFHSRIQNLHYNTRYKLRIFPRSLSLLDNTNVVNEDEINLFFTTMEEPFAELVSTSPVQNAWDVPIDGTLSFTFERPIATRGNAARVIIYELDSANNIIPNRGVFVSLFNNNTMSLTDGGKTLSFRTLSYRGNHPLEHNKKYKARLMLNSLSMVHDTNIVNKEHIDLVFRTIPDTFPYDATFTPADRSTGVEIDTDIVLNFNKPVTMSGSVITISIWGADGNRITDDLPIINLRRGDLAQMGLGQNFTSLTIDLDRDLLYDTRYIFRLAAGSLALASDSSVRNMLDLSMEFRTEEEVLFPSRRSSPTNDAIEVPVNRAITFTFSGDVDLGASPVATLTAGGESTTIDLIGALQNNVLTVDASLEHFTTYRLTLAAGTLVSALDSSVTSPLIRLAFRTVSEPFAEVLSTSPEADAVKVLSDSPTTFRFSKAVSIVGGSAQFSDRLGGQWRDYITVPLRASMLQDDGRALVVEPGRRMRNTTRHRIRIPAGSLALVSDPSSTNADVDLVFTTAAKIFTEFTTSPEEGADNVRVDRDILFHFPEPTAFGDVRVIAMTDSEGVTVPFELSRVPEFPFGTIALNPTSDLAFDTAYTITIGAGGLKESTSRPNAVTNDEIVLNFRTKTNSFPSLRRVLPARNAENVSVNSPILFTFNGHIDIKSNTLFSVSDGSRNLSGVRLRFLNNLLFVETPTTLAFETTYTVTLLPGLLMVPGESPATNAEISLSFTTEEEPFPSVSSMPPSGDTVLGIRPIIRIMFSKEVVSVDSAGLTTTFTNGDGHSVSQTLLNHPGVWQARNLAIQSSSDLQHNKLYTFRIAAGSLALATDRSITNEEAIDITFRTLRDTFPRATWSPAQNAGDVAIDSTLTLTFNKPVVPKGDWGFYVAPVGDDNPENRHYFYQSDAPRPGAEATPFTSRTYQPPRDFDPDTTYSLTIPAGLLALASDSSVTNAEISLTFTTAAEPFPGHATFPEEGAVNFPVGTPITFTFESPVSMNGSPSASLDDGNGGVVSMSLVGGLEGNLLSILPSPSLEVGVTYTLTIPAGAFSLASDNDKTNTLLRLGFTTIENPLKVYTTSIRPGASEVPPWSNTFFIRFNFDEEVALGSSPTAELVRTGADDPNPIAITFTSADIAGRVLTAHIGNLTPRQNLLYNTAYALKIPAGSLVLASSPGTQNEAITIGFTTTSFSPYKTDPLNGASDVPLGRSIEFSFLDNVSLVGTPRATFSPVDGGDVIAIVLGTINLAGNLLMIEPPSDRLLYDTEYKVELPIGSLALQSQTDVTNARPITSRFTTVEQSFPWHRSWPEQNAENIPTETSLVDFTFDEAIKIEGKVTARVIQGTTTNEVELDSDSVSGAVLTVPMPALDYSKSYLVVIPAGSLTLATNKDLLNSEITLQFTTEALAFPILVASPSDSPGLAVGQNLVLEFRKQIYVNGLGDVTLTYTTDEGSQRTTNLFLSGSNLGSDKRTLTFNPTLNLVYNAEYTLTIPAGRLSLRSHRSVTNGEISIKFSTEAASFPRGYTFFTPTNDSDDPVLIFHGDLEVNLVAGEGGFKASPSSGSGTLTLEPNQIGGQFHLRLPFRGRFDMNKEYTLTVPAGRFVLGDSATIVANEEITITFTVGGARVEHDPSEE